MPLHARAGARWLDQCRRGAESPALVNRIAIDSVSPGWRKGSTTEFLRVLHSFAPNTEHLEPPGEAYGGLHVSCDLRVNPQPLTPPLVDRKRGAATIRSPTPPGIGHPMSCPEPVRAGEAG
jgi:hypothetical protein